MVPNALLVARITLVLIHLYCTALLNHLNSCYQPTLYYISSLSGAGWVDELLTGYPQHIWVKLSVH
jgi:hypothetical protein